MTSRETVFSALFSLGQDITWTGNQTWEYSSRRFFLFSDGMPQPSFCQISDDEHSKQITGQDNVQRWQAKWFIYHNLGKDPNAIPDRLTNDILDAVQAAFTPDSFDNKCTLGGLVHHCWIDGTIKKVPGDIDGQALIIVPISILVP